LQSEDAGEEHQVGNAQDQQRPVHLDGVEGFLDRHGLRLMDDLLFAVKKHSRYRAYPTTAKMIVTKVRKLCS
jgi:hypothetical protein